MSGIVPTTPKRERRTESRAATLAGRGVVDTATVLGVPEAELTPKVRAALSQLMEEVDGIRNALQEAQRRIDYLERVSDQDSLLPVYNRRAFVRELSRVMAYSERYSTPSGVIYFDINSFKEINDKYGHAAGDAALRQVGQILMDQVRESDVVGRLGGDEFGVILSRTDGIQAHEKAAQLADQIRSSPIEFDGQSIEIRAAYGVYFFAPGDDPTAALEQADKAMYRQKGQLKAKA